MLVIDQWGTQGTEYVAEDPDLREENKDGTVYFDLYLNGECFGQDTNKSVIVELKERLENFIRYYHRKTDTFDVGSVINDIKNHK